MVFALSVLTMAAGLLVLGAYLLLVANLRGVLDRAGEQLRLVAFTELHAGASAEQVAALEARLRAQPGVKELSYVAPEAALARLRQDLGQDGSALDGLSANPLPGRSSSRSRRSSAGPHQLRELADRIAAVSGVSEVRWGEPWVEGYAKVVRVAELVGVGLGIFLLVVLGAIVASTVRLSLHARTDEIQIQRLVGAGGASCDCRSATRERCRARSPRCSRWRSCARCSRSVCRCSATRSAGCSAASPRGSSARPRPRRWSGWA